MSVLLAVIFVLQFGLSQSYTTSKSRIQIPCLDTELSLNYNNSNQTIVFKDCGNGVFNLTAQLTISVADDLQTTGDNASIIECSGNGGIALESISTLRLESLQIHNCYNSTASIHISNCADVTLKNITIKNSRGTGLLLENNTGEVLIENCIFKNNYQLSETYKNFFTKSIYDKHLGGGGVKVLIGGDVNGSSILIQKCNFLNNTAFSGGGMLIFVQANATGNNVSINDSRFINNSCPYGGGGGGGLRIGYAAVNDKGESIAVTNNRITVSNCTFSNNSALYGGGTAVFSTLGSLNFSQNKVEFTNCSWTRNTARLGMAVDIAIAPWETHTKFGLLPSPVFADCTFSEHKLPVIIRSPYSVLSVTGFRLDFYGSVLFKNNDATALDATSAELNFEPNSEVTFTKNHGVNGGAIKLSGVSVLFVNDDSSFMFVENRAEFGGAIYVESPQHSLIPSQSCFIQYKSNNKQISLNNIHLNFTDNFAGYDEPSCSPTIDNNIDRNFCNYRGDSVFATTLAPCLGECIQNLTSNHSLKVSKALACIGNFHFNKPNRRHISTAAHHFKHSDIPYYDDQMCLVYLNYTDNQIQIHINDFIPKIDPLHIQKELCLIPGKVEVLPLILVDELCGKLLFHVSVEVLQSTNGSISVDPAYTVITNNSIILHGDPHDSGVIQLSTVGGITRVITINVTLDDCPPGYVHSNDSKSCVCSAYYPDYYYSGIERCNEEQFRAYVRHGYWIGYYENDTSPNGLSSATCPKGFCANNTHLLRIVNGSERSELANTLCPNGICKDSPNQVSEYLLPSKRNKSDLSQYVCHPNRTGIICGKCKNNYSAYYHSTTFSCKPEDLCHLGWLFYILTELLPVTVLFLVVIFFNISFTSGPLNGLVFFMQVVDTLKLTAENRIKIDPQILTFAKIHKFAYRIFALRTFAIEELSYCLWQGATALDMLAFRYVTILYSLFLVMTTILLMKVCAYQYQRTVVNLKRSIIHGLSAFIVMSYSECTRVSILILTTGTIRVGPQNNQHHEYRVYYNGEFSYMGPEHLRYAIPAIFFIMTMVSIPPLLLLSYPLCYKLFALLGIEESRFVQITCKIFPLEKIKPLFDSIQGAFKDRYRFFAGMYLLYRFLPSVTYIYTFTFTAYYSINGIQFISMLFLHAVCRPYKKAWHNLLDAFLFLNLAVVNISTFFNYQKTHAYNSNKTIHRWYVAQALLVLLPLVFLVSYTLFNIIKKIKSACKCKSTVHKEIDNTNEVLDQLDARDIEEDSVIEMHDYVLLNQNLK